MSVLRRGLLTLVCAALLTVTACGSGTSAQSGGDGGSGAGGGGGKVRVAVIIKALDNPFFQSMAQGIKEAAKKYDVEVTVQAAKSTTDTTGQADKLSAMALQDYDCYLVNPITGTNLIQPLVRVEQKGAPIVNIDRPLDPKALEKAGITVATYIGTDNTHAGKLAGQHMVSLLDGSAQVALIGGLPGDVTSGERLGGFRKAAKDDLQIIQTAAADWDRGKALTMAGDILRANSQLRGFFVANDDMGLGVVRATKRAGREKVEVVSVDGIMPALKSIQAGKLSATVSQYPYTIGKMGLQACVAASNGKKLPDKVEAPVKLITPDNVGQAIKSFPKPFFSYKNPFRAMLRG